MSGVTIFGIGCGVLVLAVCVAYAVWYLNPNNLESEDK